VHPARGLKAWEAADLLADEIRAAVACFPRGRRFGIASQLVRAADSIGANISEGCGRQTVPDQIRFYNTGISSAQETLNFLKRARKANLLDPRTYFRLTNRTTVTYSLLSALIRKLSDDDGAV
jgi:four helix bundle protein